MQLDLFENIKTSEEKAEEELTKISEVINNKRFFYKDVIEDPERYTKGLTDKLSCYMNIVKNQDAEMILNSEDINYENLEAINMQVEKIFKRIDEYSISEYNFRFRINGSGLKITEYKETDGNYELSIFNPLTNNTENISLDIHSNKNDLAIRINDMILDIVSIKAEDIESIPDKEFRIIQKALYNLWDINAWIIKDKEIRSYIDTFQSEFNRRSNELSSSLSVEKFKHYAFKWFNGERLKDLLKKYPTKQEFIQYIKKDYGCGMAGGTLSSEYYFIGIVECTTKGVGISRRSKEKTYEKVGTLSWEDIYKLTKGMTVEKIVISSGNALGNLELNVRNVADKKINLEEGQLAFAF